MNMVDYISHLVLPKELQHTLFRERYQTRTTEESHGNLKGFVDLPVDIALEVSIRFNSHKGVNKRPSGLLINFCPDCQVSWN